MKTKTILPLVMAAAALAACGELRGHRPPHPQPVDRPCNDGVCKLVVTVQSCEEGALTVVPDPLTVPAPNNIEWTITTPGYKFLASGIVIQGTGFPDRPGVTGGGTKYRVHDLWTDRRPDIKYSILVYRESDGRPCKPFDPRISNQ